VDGPSQAETIRSRRGQFSPESGLAIGPEQSEILNHIDDADVAIDARYVVTGDSKRSNK
jgi:hypothetical protein